MNALANLPMAPVKDSTTYFGARTSGGLQPQTAPGGLDLLTPNLSLQPGACRDIVNFEVSVNGGYSRIGGYERFNGMASPNDATFQIIQVSSFVNVPSIGDGISQPSSGATATIAYVYNMAGVYYMVVTQVEGTFDDSGVIETAPTELVITEAGGPLVITSASSPYVIPTSLVETIGTAIPTTVQLTAQLNAQYQVYAADIYRALIDPVPGSGPITGIVHMIFNGVDNVYAFRANTAATAVNIYKATTSGWVNVPLFNVVSFTAAGGVTPQDGDTLTQGPATATIMRVMIGSGTIAGSTAAGTFVVTTPTFGFSAGAATTSSGTTLTLSGPSTPITLTPGGKFEFVKYNFSGQLATRYIYACDGVNQAAEFDGTTWAPITTGLSPDAPTHITAHKTFLFLAQGSSIFYSAAGFPFKWNATDGAGEIATGDNVNAMLTLPGAANTATLGVWMRSSVGLLYGTDPTTFNFTQYNVGLGGIAGSVQNLFDSFGFAEPGVVNLQTTLNFGNFQAATLTKNIQPFINEQRSKITTSTVSHIKGQYRVFFNDGYGLYLTILNQVYLGAAIVQFPTAVNVIDTDTDTDGNEVSYFGSTDELGYVYQLDTGPNFDGEELPASFTGAWDYMKTPRFLKQYRCASVEMQGNAYAAVSFSYNLSDNTSLVGQPTPQSYTSNFAPSFWDSGLNWDSGFVWDGATTLPTYVNLSGTGYNIQPIVTTGTNYIQPFNVSTVIYQYSMRRRVRGL